MKKILLLFLLPLFINAVQPFNNKPLPHENSPAILIYISKDDQGNYFVKKVDIPVQNNEKIAMLSFRVIFEK